jgi:hypothetical protein
MAGHVAHMKENKRAGGLEGDTSKKEITWDT